MPDRKNHQSKFPLKAAGSATDKSRHTMARGYFRCIRQQIGRAAPSCHRTCFPTGFAPNRTYPASYLIPSEMRFRPGSSQRRCCHGWPWNTDTAAARRPPGLGDLAIQSWTADVVPACRKKSPPVRHRSSSASMAVSAGSLIFILPAANPIALMNQADQPAASSTTDPCRYLGCQERKACYPVGDQS